MIHEPIAIEPCMQKDGWDCGIAALQMVLGVSYADVRRHVRAKSPDGLSNRQVMRIAKALGRPLSHRPYAGEDDIGILDLQRQDANQAWQGHFAVYVKGTVYDPADGVWWTDVEAYLAKSRYRVMGLFVRV